MSDDAIEQDVGVSEDGLRACDEILRAGDCRSVRYFAEVDSTNSAACRDLVSGQMCDADRLPRLYLADRQTSGRGRHGRSWLADNGTLTFSILYGVGEDEQSELSEVPLVALATGVAIARTIEYLAAPVSAKIKWPNDVHVAGGKVAGVLVESVANHSDRLVVGIGLNVATQLNQFRESIAQPARSIADVSRGPSDRYAWLTEIVNQMGHTYRRMRTDPELLIDEVRCRCMLAGTPVRYQMGEASITGRCIGIDPNGALLVQTDTGVRPIHCGEVNPIRQ
ncbi:MAG TPA: biotin--[acetyl-CoA-carboxylase] ligase [Planctomycetaceae bacterium]|nr:biotin--[acetyl-CoA-carboxylase] ligase [Planctomycetaceae bacterium]